MVAYPKTSIRLRGIWNVCSGVEQNSECIPCNKLQGKRANAKQSTYLAAERPQERLLLTVKDSLRYYWQAYSPQVEGVKLPSDGCVGGFNSCKTRK